LTNFFKVIHPRESNLQNIKDFTKVATDTRSPGVLGMMNTVWCPYRFLQGAVVHGIALGASIFRNGGQEKESFSEEFAADYFGVAAAPAIGRAIRSVYTIVPELLLVKSLAPLDGDEFEPLNNMEIQQCERMGKEATEILTVLLAGRDRVSRNITHYDDIIVTMEIIADLAQNGEDIGQLFEIVTRNDFLRGKIRDPRAWGLLQSLAGRTRSLHGRALDCWSRTRFEDNPDRDGRTHIHAYDASVLYRLNAAAEFFERLMPDAAA
jgi:hypothetical protein